MEAGEFVHLHTHSEFSLLDGACRIDDLVRQAAAQGMPALALTDHGVMYGALSFYDACKKGGVKPIIGCEVYLAPRSRTSRQPKLDSEPYHLVLLCKDEEGYRNLLKLSTAAFLEGFYYKPRVDKELLSRHSRGLIALTACMAGEVTRACASGDINKAEAALAEYVEIFGRDNVYLEIQDHGLPEQKKANELLPRLSERTGIPLVATNDIHYLSQKDAEAHDVLLCIQTGAVMDDPDRLRFGSQEFFMKTPGQMRERFKRFPGSIEQTLEIASRCNLELDFSRLQLPDVEIPEGRTVDQHLETLCYEGLNRLYPNAGPEILERLAYELDVIKKTGFSQYMLIVHDFARFATENDIYIGLRGSAAGSLVCYCLGISRIDPIRYGLGFERFLSIERAKMPDIDMDMSDDRRGDIIRYVTEKYGQDRVAQIVTFGTLAARAAVRDVGKVMGMAPSEVDRLCKMIPALPVGITIARAKKENPDLEALYRSNPDVKRVLDTAEKLEGISRHASVHAAGIIISREPLVEHVPLMKAARGEELVTQYDADNLTRIGLLKMDFLGLANLTTLARTVENIKLHRGEEIDIWNIPLDDRKTFEMLGQAETTGVFQLESAGMRRNIAELKPENIEQLAALIALYRPGPMAQIPAYIKGKMNPASVKYIHPKLEPILKDTYGVIVFQEQVLQIVQAIAGFTLGQADVLRYAMSKKKKEDMRAAKEQIVAGAVANGLSRSKAEEIFALIEPFAGYAFNKSHATCYAMLAYQTAYLKANYPVEYMAALLATNIDNKDKVALYIDECRRRKIDVLPPDVNESETDFSIQGDAIRFGLAAIKNCGKGMVEEIIAERRRGGPYRSLHDFCERLLPRGIGKANIECLIKAGAFGSISGSRAGLLCTLDEAIRRATRIQREREMGQAVLFGAGQETSSIPEPEAVSLTEKEYSREELLAMEKELLGLYITDHPLAHVREILQERITCRSDQVPEKGDGQECVIGGVITSVRLHRTKKNNETMAFLRVEDLWGTIPVMVFPSVYRTWAGQLTQDRLVIIKGKTSQRDRAYGAGESSEIEVVCESVELLDPQHRQMAGVKESSVMEDENAHEREAGNGADNGRRFLHIRLTNGATASIDRLRTTLSHFPGSVPICFHVRNSDGQECRVVAPLTVNPSERLFREIQEIVGRDAVWVD